MRVSFPKLILFLLLVSVTAMSLSSCAKRDCRGRKKTANTAMGGWL